MGGMMSITGEPDGMPQKVGVAFSDLMTGLDFGDGYTNLEHYLDGMSPVP